MSVPSGGACRLCSRPVEPGTEVQRRNARGRWLKVHRACAEQRAAAGVKRFLYPHRVSWKLDGIVADFDLEDGPELEAANTRLREQLNAAMQEWSNAVQQARSSHAAVDGGSDGR